MARYSTVHTEDLVNARLVTRHPRAVDIPCACGCGSLVPSLNRWGRETKFVKGHYDRAKAKKRRKSPEQLMKASLRVVVTAGLLGECSRAAMEKGVNLSVWVREQLRRGLDEVRN